MSVCTFFGHRDCPSSIEPNLKQALIHLIDAQSVDTFYVGNHGAFDAMVRTFHSGGTHAGLSPYSLYGGSSLSPHKKACVSLSFPSARWH